MENSVTTGFDLTPTQEDILLKDRQKSPKEKLEGQWIKRSDIKEEKGDWYFETMEQNLDWISSGGEAIVVKDSFGGFDAAVRVHPFDSILFTEDNTYEKYNFIPKFARGEGTIEFFILFIELRVRRG